MTRSPRTPRWFPCGVSLGVLTAALGCTPAEHPVRPVHPVAPQAGAPAGQPVVVALVVDQLAAWVLDARIDALAPSGGFARLRREGTWARRVTYPYAVTDTAPGHATLFTGTVPRDGGVYANETCDRHNHRVSILLDPATHRVSETGVEAAVGSSAAMLRVPTVADRLRARTPDAVVVSVSLKDRGAIPGGGTHPTVALWFDADGQRFVTSTAFGNALPPWAVTAGGTAAVQTLESTPWSLDNPDEHTWVAHHAATPDAQPGEGDLAGFGTVFPHGFRASHTPGWAFRASPRGDEAVLALGLAAVDHARRPDAPMLLALSLSSNDYVGHVFGPDSWEAWDELWQLDAQLGAFFTALDTRLGPAGWRAVLSADHGGSPLPETVTVPGARPWCDHPADDPFHRPCRDPLRVQPDALSDELQSAVVRALGPGNWVQGMADPYVHLGPDAAGHRDDVVRVLTAALRAHPEVVDVRDARVGPVQCPDGSDDSPAALLCRSLPARGPDALYVLLREGAFFDPLYTPGYGTSHGTTGLYDRTVPLFVRAPGAVAGRTVDTMVDARSYAAVVACALGMPWTVEGSTAAGVMDGCRRE